MSTEKANQPAKKSETKSKKEAGAALKKSAAKSTKKKKKAVKSPYEVGTFHSIPLNKIEVTENLVRHSEFSSRYYQALAASMVTNGYQPIDVYRKDNRFYISDGFTRYEAFSRVQKDKINCIIIAPEKALANALHKAMLRNDLTALERALAYQKYMNESEPKKTAADLAKEFRKSPTNISQILSVLRLPEGMINNIKGKPFTLRDLLQLVEQENNLDEQWALYNDIANKRKELKDEKTQYGSDIHPDDSDDESDLEERLSGDENADSGSTEKAGKVDSGESKERKTRFEAIEHKIKEVHKRIESMLKIDMPNPNKKGPKKEPLTDEQKAAIKSELEAIIKTLEAPVEIPTETASEPDTSTETSEAAPETVEGQNADS